MFFTIDFQPLGLVRECQEGQTLLDCARLSGIDIINDCGGMSTCGTCKVRIMSGQVSGLTHNEESTFTESEISAGWRLACKVKPLSNCTVHIPPESLLTAR